MWRVRREGWCGGCVARSVRGSDGVGVVAWAVHEESVVSESDVKVFCI